MNLDLPSEGLLILLNALEQKVVAYRKILDHTGDWQEARRVLPMQKPFHSARLRGSRS